MEKNISPSIDTTVPTIYSRTDYPTFRSLYGFCLWHFLWFIFMPTYLSVHFAYLDFSSVFLTTMPAIFSDIYHEEPGIAGLHYIALGIGLSIGSVVIILLLDSIYIHFKNKNGGVGEPEFRLRE